MGKCDSCGSCGTCGGCSGGPMELNPGELTVLRTLSQIPFLPVARKMDDPTPVCLEETELDAEESGLVLMCLEKKGLISVDFDKPLKSFDYARYTGFPLRGSMALTARGQQVVELMEIQGILE